MEIVRRNAAIYFAVQAIAVTAWWMALYFYPSVRGYYRLGATDEILLAFWMPDLILISAGSLVSAVLLATRSNLATAAMWLTAGGASYATLYCLSYAMLYDSGWLGVVFMSPMMIASGNFAIGATPEIGAEMFRRSATSEFKRVFAKTIAQIIVVWTTILVILPSIIVWIEARVGSPQFAFPMQKPLAAILFVIISSLGVSASYTMSKIGGGTPLPMDTASKLVIRGVYAYVRNPMAISGIGQGLMVALWYGSPLVAVYAITGAMIWQAIFRPLEEEDLVATFGDEFEDYRRNVKCWIPRATPYSAIAQEKKDAISEEIAS